VTGTIFGTFAQLDFALGGAVAIWAADFDAVPGFIGTLIATFLLDVVVFIDTVWIGNVVRTTWTITLTKLVVAWTSIWTVCMARAVIAAFVEVRIVTFVLAECITMTC
jgi:uncharacterized metal-binding protein